MIDLKTKQAFWAEQLPAFKENYICLAQLDAVVFNNETGNFDALDKDATGFDPEDILEAYHSVNTGWAMWLRAMSQEKAKAQAVPDGFKLVPVELSEEIAERLAAERVQKPRPENDPVWVEIAERAYKSNLLAKKWELVREYKILTEANESGAEG
nr:hypothetical protein [Acinetobacter oleivorans]